MMTIVYIVRKKSQNYLETRWSSVCIDVSVYIVLKVIDTTTTGPLRFIASLDRGVEEKPSFFQMSHSTLLWRIVVHFKVFLLS